MIARKESDPSRERAPEGPSSARTDRTRPEALRSALDHALKGAAHVHALLQVRADRTRIALRRSAMIAAAIVLAITALVPLIVGGAVLFTLGLSQSLSHWLGDRVWLGNLLGGIAIFALVGACAWLAYARIARRDFQAKLAKYRRMRRAKEKEPDEAAA
jgi:hypothetical protein